MPYIENAKRKEEITSTAQVEYNGVGNGRKRRKTATVTTSVYEAPENG
jgi:hypothetical protein